jgi:WD40 repeat protein
MRYLDFDLEIGLGSGQDYPVAVLRSPAGEAHATMRFPFDEAALDTYHETIQAAMSGSGQARRQASQTVQDFGQQLFEALFTGNIRSCYDVSQREATRQDDRGLRVKLRVQAPDLAALPWEFLYDARQGEYLCLSRQTPLVRYLELPQSAEPLQIKPPLRILGMVASPSNQEQLDIPRERGRIEEALSDLQARGLVELTWLEGQTWRDLQRAMRAGPWHIFHFIGHGGFDPRSDEGVLLLADEQGKASLLTATQMGHLLADHRSLRLALLNACEGASGSQRDLFSSTAATLARRGIPAILAMQYEITDRAAIECTRAFYEALADALPVDAAVSEARKAITLSIANTLEWATPVLYMRSPDGALFEIAKEKRHKPAATAHKPKPEATTPAETPAPLAPAAPSVPRGTILAVCRAHEDGIAALAWSPDNRRVASASYDSTVQLWNAATGSHVLTYSGHTWRVRAVAWSPDGSRIASGGDDGTMQVWDAKDGSLRFTYQGHCNTVAWSPDGARLATGGGGGTVEILDSETGEVIFSYDGHEDAVTSLAWSPDGSRIASASTDATVQVWVTTPGGSAFTYRGHRESVWAVAWSSDSKHIASAGDPDGRVYVWDTTTWGNVYTYDGHTARVVALAWAPTGGTHIASGGEDNKVHLWDASNGTRLYTFTEHEEHVAALAWSRDGKRIASASDNEISIRIWQAE